MSACSQRVLVSSAAIALIRHPDATIFAPWPYAADRNALPAASIRVTSVASLCLPRPPGGGDSVISVDEHVQLLADVDRVIGPLDCVKHLEHARVHPLRV